MLTENDFGTNYTYEISRRSNCVRSNCDKSNNTTIIREDDVNVSLAEASREPKVPLEDESLKIDKFNGVFSNILTDPDNSPRYIFTNVWISSDGSTSHTQMHSVPASMVENLCLVKAEV